MEISALIGFAELVLAFDLNVIEQWSDRKPLDLGALTFGSAFSDKRQQHAACLQCLDRFARPRKEISQLVTIGREASCKTLCQFLGHVLQTSGDKRVGDHLPASLGYSEAGYLVTHLIRPEFRE